MKNLIIIIAATLLSTSVAFAGSSPVDAPVTIDNDKMSFSLVSSIFSDEMEFYYDDAREEMQIVSHNSEISFVQLIDANGELQYQLPIGSDQLNVALNDFEQGSYTLNILLNNNDSIVEAKVNVK